MKITFQKGFFKKYKNKNVLEFDVEKDGGIFFKDFVKKEDYPFKITRKIFL